MCDIVMPGTWEYFDQDGYHREGDPNCDWCFGDEHPQKCDCGGLLHRQINNSYDQDMRGWTNIVVRCDKCGKEKDE